MTEQNRYRKKDTAEKRAANRPPISAYERMVVLLSRRDHSSHELTAKLKKAEHSSAEIDEALEFARTRNWLPDETVLAAREAGRLARAGKSPSQISAWLKKKGLPTKGFAIEENEEESAHKTASKSWARLVRTAERDLQKAAEKKAKGEKRSTWGGSRGTGSLEDALKMRVTRLLLSRGFSSTTARMVFTRLLNENPL